MEIRAIEPYEMEALLGRSSIGRLACARDGQPYICPLNFVADDGYLYGFTTVGQKIDWMRSNPRVCILFDEIESAWNWSTVVVTGSYEELSGGGSTAELRVHAFELLRARRPLWWEPAYVKTRVATEDLPLETVYFRIRVHEITGRRGVPDVVIPEQVEKRRSSFSAAFDGFVHWFPK